MLLLKTCARACRFLTHAAAVAKEPAVPPSPSSWTAAACVCHGADGSVSQFTFPPRFLSCAPRCWSKTVFVETSQPSLASATSIGTQTGSYSESKLKVSLSFYEGTFSVFSVLKTHMGKGLWIPSKVCGPSWGSLWLLLLLLLLLFVSTAVQCCSHHH